MTPPLKVRARVGCANGARMVRTQYLCPQPYASTGDTRLGGIRRRQVWRRSGNRESQAGRRTGEFRRREFRTDKVRFLAGLAVLREQELTDPRWIAAIEYC